jgi:uncharacterized protein YdhG (YjbR/CyaY superfamily)
MNKKESSINEYIAGFPPEVQQRLKQLRAAIRHAAPDATESINYGIPTFKWMGNLVHFAAFKKHIGLYPGATGIARFKIELAKFSVSKGGVQFPIHQDLPLELVTKIVQFRVLENRQIAETKGKIKTCPKGHQFYKSSDCPSCPQCAALQTDADDCFRPLSAPARRALEQAGITHPEKLAGFTQKEILALHGIGPAAIPVMKKLLAARGLDFRKTNQSPGQ